MQKRMAIMALVLAAAAPAGNADLLARFADQLLLHKDPSGAFALAAPTMIQHNPMAKDGRDAAVALTAPLFKHPGARFVPLHLLVDGDMIFLHYHGQLGPGAGANVAELFRVSDHRLVEHWDAFQPDPDTNTVAAPGVVSGGENRALVEDFARTLYVARDVRAAFARDVTPGLIQHGEAGQGRDAAIARLAPMFADPAEHYTVAHILAAGAYGVIHVDAVNSREHNEAAVFDILRMDGGKVVEIWPIIQIVPSNRVNPRSPI